VVVVVTLNQHGWGRVGTLNQHGWGRVGVGVPFGVEAQMSSKIETCRALQQTEEEY